MSTSPDALIRGTIWQPATGTVWDADAREVLKAWRVSAVDQFFKAGDGSDSLQQTRHEAALDIVPELLAQGIRIIQRQDCPVRAVFFGWRKHTLWLEETLLNSVAVRAGTSLLATQRIQLTKRIVAGHIYDDQNLLFGFPWHCARAAPLGGTPPTSYRLYQYNPDTPLGWTIPNDGLVPSVSYAGLLNAPGGEAVLEFEFPVPGCTLKYFGTGTLDVLAHPASPLGVLNSIVNGGIVTLPPQTWSLRITVPHQSLLPRLEVSDVGKAVGYRFGICNPCDLPLTTEPPWSEPDAFADPENLRAQITAPFVDVQNLKVAVAVAVADAQNLKIDLISDGSLDAQNLKAA